MVPPSLIPVLSGCRESPNKSPTLASAIISFSSPRKRVSLPSERSRSSNLRFSRFPARSPAFVTAKKLFQVRTPDVDLSPAYAVGNINIYDIFADVCLRAEQAVVEQLAKALDGVPGGMSSRQALNVAFNGSGTQQRSALM